MAYDAERGKEEPTLPSDTILNGKIVEIKDGKVKDFIHSDKWKGDLQQEAIELQIQVKHNEMEFNFGQVFTYKSDGELTAFTPKSNLAKYKKKYGKLPEVGDEIKTLTNSDGFLKLKLD